MLEMICNGNVNETKKITVFVRYQKVIGNDYSNGYNIPLFCHFTETDLGFKASLFTLL